ncbi:pre-mRNA processing factor 3-domain-containing protein [Amanita rubescens]|nr:pre-mRNA processing factor 3-domain-containing protein [Amanita rubescens]
MSDRKRVLEANGDSTSSNTSTPSRATADAELIARKRAEISAKLASFRSVSFGVGTGPPTITPKFAAPIPVKPAAPLPTVPTPSPSASSRTTSAAGPSGPGTPATSDDLARRVAEAKRRVAEAQTKLAVKDNPYMSVSQNKKKGSAPVEQAQQGAGLKMAAHPLLLDTTPTLPQSKKDRYKPMQPKFASIKANARNAPTPPPPPAPTKPPESSNPYAVAVKDTGFEGAPRERSGRSFRFNPKGKYVALANQVRRENQLEDLKQRIAESARKAGFDGDMSIEKTLKRPPPPATEWWDASLLPTKSYDDLEFGPEYLNLDGPSSPITIYVQHPIPIPAPGDKNKAALKPMKLTTKEQKKMRRLRRKESLQDKRDRIRMGLLPPDAPKVRLANLMKVLTSDAVQDPTRVEARVRREVAMRKHQHEKMNAERKLTDEERREKIETKKAEEDKKGIYGAVFKVAKLHDPAHQFKVRRNAEQMNLSGVCIFNPQFNFVYVEGGAKFIRQYKRLMIHRIVWTESARPRGREEVELEENPEEAEKAGPSVNGIVAADAPANGGEAEEEDSPSLQNNKCWLIWEGLLRDRVFNTFRAKSCPTDRDAKELLGEKMRGYWDQAKNWKPEEEELF